MSPAGALGRTRAWLDRARSPDGTFGYRPGQQPAAEPTLLAVAAGQPAPLDWLAAADLGWARLMLPAALRSPEAGPLREAAVSWALSVRGNQYETAGTYDGFLVGWPWVEGTFTWVEPTAWAVLGLRAAGQGEHPRVQEGLRVLADRQCTDGGWNAGTPDILGKELFGYLYATGLVLMALPPGHPSVPAARRFLSGVRERPSPLNLSAAILAERAHGGEVADLAALLVQKQDPDGGFAGRVDRTALAACALAAATGEPCPLVV